MLTLILMRHGEATSDYSDDFSRTLTIRGEMQAHQTAGLLRAAGLHPDIVISSDAIRAMQTADIVASELDCHRRAHAHFLYEGHTTDDFLTCLSTLAADAHVAMVVAHNPDISYRALRLSEPGAPIFSFMTGAAYALQFETDSWESISAGRIIFS